MKFNVTPEMWSAFIDNDFRFFFELLHQENPSLSNKDEYFDVIDIQSAINGAQNLLDNKRIDAHEYLQLLEVPKKRIKTILESDKKTFKYKYLFDHFDFLNLYKTAHVYQIDIFSLKDDFLLVCAFAFAHIAIDSKNNKTKKIVVVLNFTETSLSSLRNFTKFSNFNSLHKIIGMTGVEFNYFCVVKTDSFVFNEAIKIAIEQSGFDVMLFENIDDAVKYAKLNKL